MNKNGWIACRERLPEVEDEVLLSLEDGSIMIGYRTITIVTEDEESFYIYHNPSKFVEQEEVVAWQPLPKPYKELENND